ncbi:mechanosensitive ion channel family protein [Tomitella biformata]|uniref:mechanosensitive ion channel family protein n=1 Tax=Tomitella biformata TaxID=630403 RepID=UPI0004673828|nr:mechanosensitive ion channel family protein [Tomitella biformata]
MVLASGVFGPTSDIKHWFQTEALQILLIALGAVLLCRFVKWGGNRITARIDRKFQGSDQLVRTERSKHNHAMTQVISYVTIGVVAIVAILNIVARFGVPITSLVAPATVLGAGLGFGAQRIVQDFLAGFFIITERQYGYGDVVSIVVPSGIEPAEGTVEDVTLRYTRLRNADGEVITIPNGQIVKASNLSRDWARSVIDVPVPPNADVNHVTDVLIEVGEAAFEDKKLNKYLLDAPTVMGIESLTVDAVHLRMVARTLPGKQFEVGRELRVRVARALLRYGIIVPDIMETASQPTSQPMSVAQEDKE